MEPDYAKINELDTLNKEKISLHSQVSCCQNMALALTLVRLGANVSTFHARIFPDRPSASLCARDANIRNQGYT